jgi:hypothetical protein
LRRWHGWEVTDDLRASAGNLDPKRILSAYDITHRIDSGSFSSLLKNSQGSALLSRRDISSSSHHGSPASGGLEPGIGLTGTGATGGAGRLRPENRWGSKSSRQ